MMRRVVVTSAAVALGAGVFVSSVATATGPCSKKLCAEEIATGCAGLKGTALSACSKSVLLNCNTTDCSCTDPTLPACAPTTTTTSTTSTSSTTSTTLSSTTSTTSSSTTSTTASSTTTTSGNTTSSSTTSTTTTTTIFGTTTTSSTTTTTLPTGCHLPATGQTTCWDSNGNLIPCAGTGQDGDLQKGGPLSYTDNGDGTITDNNTGLVWEKQSQDGSIHDVSNLYTWDQAFSVHVAGLNTMNFAGHSDWRLPNVRELPSIVNYRDFFSQDPFVSPAFNTGCTPGCTVLTCSCTAPLLYWPSTTSVDIPASAWVVGFGNGVVGLDPKDLVLGGLPVRAVRGDSSCLPATGQTTCWDSSGTVTACAGTGQDGDLQKGAPLSYTDNGDGTITDNNTGLVWEKLSQDGSIHDVSNTYSWEGAFTAHVAGLNTMNFAGHSDWRLPNVKELPSIGNYGNSNPSVSPAFNTGCAPGCTVLTCSCTAASSHWSSTTFVGGPTIAWIVDFLDADVNITGKSQFHFVRAVRGLCGDGLCGPSEDCSTCAQDCGTCPTTTTTTSTSTSTTSSTTPGCTTLGAPCSGSCGLCVEHCGIAGNPLICIAIRSTSIVCDSDAVCGSLGLCGGYVGHQACEGDPPGACSLICP